MTARVVPAAAAPVLYVVAAAAAITAQVILGQTRPWALAVLALTAVLALITRQERWTVVLTLSHVLSYALLSPPRDVSAWAALAGLAVSIGGLHLLAPWLPRAGATRAFEILPGARLHLATTALTLVLLALGSAALAATAPWLLPTAIRTPVAVVSVAAVVLSLALGIRSAHADPS